MKKIGIIGQGFVGNSIKEGLKDTYPNILTYDLNPELRNCSSLQQIVNECECLFVCVPTPMNADGSCHLNILEKLIQDIYDIDKQNYSSFINNQKIIIIKPTVPPGTTKRLQISYPSFRFVFNPEFLTEANAVNDFKNQDRIILGSSDKGALQYVTELYEACFPIIPIVKTSFEKAEMVKYVINTFLMVKVSFANEMYQICDKLGINYEEMINIAKLDKRLGNSHWKVPGPDGHYGAGGSCFIKDINSLRYLGNLLNVKTTMLNASIEKNDEVRPEKDWQQLKGRAVI